MKFSVFTAEKVLCILHGQDFFMLLSHIPNISCECSNLKFALKLPNVMRIYGAGLVQNDVFAKVLRMLADPYKCLKNVAIDCHPHYRILENALRMFRKLTNAVTNNTNVLQTPYK